MFVHTPTKSLILKVRDPLRFRDILPRESRVIVSPHGNLVVKHTLETTVVLRNMGIKAPSPILNQYPWPGKHKPYDHQMVMADMLTVHPKVFNLSEMGCVSADTEYLSPEGWRRIDQYTAGAVAQYLPETGEIEFVEPTKFVRLPCEDMISFETSRGVSQMLSPEHRVLLADGSVVSAEHIAQRWGTQSVENRRFRFRTTFKVRSAPGVALSDAELRVHVAMSADATMATPNRAVMRLKKPAKIARVKQLLADAGIAYSEHPAKPEGFVRIAFHPLMPKGLGGLWGATQAQLEVIADEAPHWDGSQLKAKGVAFFGVKADCNLIQYAFSASGKRASMLHDAREYVLGDQYTVHASNGDPTVGLVSRNSTRGPSVFWSKSPDGFKYCFMVPSTFLLLRRNGNIFATGNTGKTYAALWAADYLMTLGLVKRCAILAPLSTLKPVWERDIFDILLHRNVVVVHGSVEHRLKMLNADVDFYIINHDGVKIEAIAKMLRRRKDIDLVILDEASVFRNAKPLIYRFLDWVLEKKPRFWPITGTPTPNNPTDAWALARLINRANVPQFFGAFRRETMMQVSQFKWVAKKGAEERAYRALQPAVRFKKADCLSLPPVVTLDRQTRLTKEQRVAFDEMRKEMIASIGAGQITAANAADQIAKLRQILLGAVFNPTTNSYDTLPHTYRLGDLRDAIDEANAKVIVVVPFKGIIRVLEKELLPHYSCAILNGDVSATARAAIIRDFKTKPDPHLLLCHPKVMSHGLNLVEADTLIFYGPIYSNDQYKQVIERNNRPGQTRSMRIIRIAAHPIEWDIYRMVDMRGISQDNILSLFKQVTE